MADERKRLVSDNKYQYKWQKTVTLTKQEGAEFEAILSEIGCQNASQLCKGIARREIGVIRIAKEGAQSNE